jgi:hypothetical protein
MSLPRFIFCLIDLFQTTSSCWLLKSTMDYSTISSLLSRYDSSIIISHCHLLSYVVLNDFPGELFLQRSFILKLIL